MAIHPLIAVALVVIVALTGVTVADAAGAVNIMACQTLSTPNTVYKLATDLSSCDTCLIIAADRVTIDLQGRSITSTCPNSLNTAAITDQKNPFNLITVKNGTVQGYTTGVELSSTRASVLGITATNNLGTGILVSGSQGLVKASEVSGSFVGIQIRDHGQVQQSNAHNDGFVGIFAAGDNCLLTMNTANFNVSTFGLSFGIVTAFANKCTVSYNTASNNGGIGIDAGAEFGGNGHLVNHNVALNNAVDYVIRCPSDVTNNTSTNGFPASYLTTGPPTGCRFVNNN